jgi:hypothetical protein
MNTKHILITILAACFPLMGLSQTAESLSSDNKLTQQEVIELLNTPSIRTHVVCEIHHPPYREDFNAGKVKYLIGERRNSTRFFAQAPTLS